MIQKVLEHFNYSRLFYTFLAIILLKTIIAAIFSSGYQNQLFLPFVEYFVTNHSSPWEYFYQNNMDVDFPYPPLMLYILSPFVYLIKYFSAENIVLTNLIFKTPLLVFDIATLYALYNLFPNNKKSVLLIYFLSPIVIYASYVQSQLDIIPTCLMLFSVIYILRDKPKLSALFFALAMLAKSSVLVALPLIIIYLFKNKNYKSIASYLSIIAAIYLIISTPFIFSEAYQNLVFGNKEQSLIFNLYQQIVDLRIYILPVAILIIYARFFDYSKINNDLFLGYVGIVFVLLLVLVYPIPSWYVWVVPYLTIFLIGSGEYKNKSLILYCALCFLYLIYSIFLFKHPFSDAFHLNFLGNPINPDLGVSDKIADLIFSVIEFTLIIFIYLIYKISIKSNQIYKRKSPITIIGIAGDSGSGKTTTLGLIKNIIKDKHLLELEGDGDHKWERGDKKWEEFTHLDPRANKLHDQFWMLRTLKENLPVTRRDYDHSTGKFTAGQIIRPKQYIAISGLHPFYLPKARKIIDIKIYLEPEEKLRQHFKILRDKNKRGYNKEEVLKQISNRSQDREKYILPQEKYADLCFKIGSENNFELGEENQNIRQNLKVIINANIVLDSLYEELEKIESINFSYDYSPDLDRQEIRFVGSITGNDLSKIANKVVENVEEIIDLNPTWLPDYQGLQQLFVIIMISNFLKNEI